MAADPATLAALALEVAVEAGELVQRRRAEGVQVAETKTSATDIVTRADQDSEDLIRARLRAARPEDGFLGEEGGDEEGSSGLRWIADPIDGTVNYFLGLPNYAVSLAVAEGERVLAGVVVNPSTGERYVGIAGGGATCNGVPLRVREPRDWTRAVVSTGFSYEPEVRARQADAVARLLREVADIRRFGSCALDLCAVAAGRSDGYVEEGVRLWDHAAAGLIAQEAGAGFELLTGANGRDLVIAAHRDSVDGLGELAARCGFVGGPAPAANL